MKRTLALLSLGMLLISSTALAGNGKLVRTADRLSDHVGATYLGYFSRVVVRPADARSLLPLVRERISSGDRQLFLTLPSRLEPGQTWKKVILDGLRKSGLAVSGTRLSIEKAMSKSGQRIATFWVEDPHKLYNPSTGRLTREGASLFRALGPVMERSKLVLAYSPDTPLGVKEGLEDALDLRAISADSTRPMLVPPMKSPARR